MLRDVRVLELSSPETMLAGVSSPTSALTSS